MKMRWCKIRLLLLGGLLASYAALGGAYQLADVKDRLQFLEPEHWDVADVKGRTALVLKEPGEWRPPVRRPGEFALWKGEQPLHTFAVQAASLESSDVAYRDVCVIFGYRDDTHFYYAHVSSRSDNRVHNVIMRVDGTSRTRINREKDPEPRLTDGWHTVRVVHKDNGAIQLYVDDMQAPLMTAQDTTYPVGRIGFGTMDDRAAFSILSFD